MSDAEPLIWRIPPWQPAVLLLITSACAALNIYAQPSVTVRIATIMTGLAALCSAVGAIRMYFVVDSDGIWIRRFVTGQLIEWDDVLAVKIVVLKHGNSTVRIVRGDSSEVDVPPSLLQPTMPTRNARAMAALGNVARQVEARADHYRR